MVKCLGFRFREYMGYRADRDDRDYRYKLVFGVLEFS